VRRALLSQSVEELYIIGDGGRLLYFNEAARRVHAEGREVDLVVGRPAAALAPESARQAFERNLRRALDGETVVLRRNISEFDYLDDWREYRYQPVSGEDGSVEAVSLVVRDLTEQRVLEQQVMEAHKMEAVGRLAGGVAHDFNNILTIIESHAYLADSKIEEEASVRRSLGQIREAVERGARLTRQLLKVSPEHTGDFERVDVADTLEQLAGFFSRVLGAGIALEVEVDERVGEIACDLAQFEQIVMNLVLNARDALSDGGEIRLEARLRELERPGETGWPVELEPGAYLEVTIADTGVGMEPETCERVFEPFFTTKGAEGTGLGLATVYGIVASYGGDVTVESEPGAGTTFRVYLPAAESVSEGQ
jgi:PAS domain S-box-containing protein